MMSEPKGYDPEQIMTAAANALHAASVALASAAELARQLGWEKIRELYDAESTAARYMVGAVAAMITAETPGSSDTDRAIVPIATGLADDYAAVAFERWEEMIRNNPDDDDNGMMS